MSKTKARAQSYFEQNKTVEKLHSTSDGTPFLNKQDALAHATTLEDKNVTTFHKNKMDAPEADLTDAEKEIAKVAADKVAAAKKVAEAKKTAEAKKQADTAEKAKTNSAGKVKHPANTGADQKTAK